MIKIGQTLEELKASFASGEEKLKEDEYFGDDGLPYCKKCKTRRFYSIDNGQWAIRGMCKCQEEERRRQEEEEAARKRMEEFNNRKALSLTGKRYRNIMFADATITQNNSKAYEKMCDIALIKFAIHKAAQGKTQKHYIKKVLANIDDYALKIQDMLVNDKVVLSPNRQVELYDHSCSKMRTITVPKFFPDQVLHWVLMLVIEPIIQKGMYRYSCGSVPGRGGMEAKRFVEKSLER